MASPPAKKRGTTTSSFGVGKREAHDSTSFYSRFSPPEITDDETVHGPVPGLGTSTCFVGSSTDMSQLPDNSVGLVVTSPPYFVGKDYELAIADGDSSHLPNDYLEFLEMLRAVFAECLRVLEPGGRIAVNVANLGRKPYRSLSADVTAILQDDLGMLMRGEIIWQKSKTSSGSCAWGSFASAGNPVLRDVTERVVVASKGRFSRALGAKRRRELGLAHVSTISNDQFVDITRDVWEIDAESAKRVGHPAPFPVELPRRLIELYTYLGDIVVDPFAGSGTSLVAAERTGRVGVGYDLDENYVALAKERIAAERERSKRIESAAATSALAESDLPGSHIDKLSDGPRLAQLSPSERQDHFTNRATEAGKKILDIATERLGEAGFTFDSRRGKISGGSVTFSGLATSADGGADLYVDVVGGFTTERPGLQRSDAVWRTLGRAATLRAHSPDARLLVLTSSAPRPGSEGERALREVGPTCVFDVIELFDPEGLSRLAKYGAGGLDAPIAGFWDESELAGVVTTALI